MLETAEGVLSGPHTLKHIAASSGEILVSLGRSGGRSKTTAQTVAKSYYKVLQSLLGLESDLEAAQIPLQPPAAAPRFALQRGIFVHHAEYIFVSAALGGFSATNMPAKS